MGKNEPTISFWKKIATGNLLSHGKGLSEEQVEFLRSLNVGDRLICWSNNNKPGEENKPTHNLKRYKTTAQLEQEKAQVPPSDETY